MNNNPLLKLEAFDQSIWIDFIRRGTILSGELKRLIDEDGVTGKRSLRSGKREDGKNV